MEPILQALDAEWSRLATSPLARRSLIRWGRAHPAMAGLSDLDGVLRRRRDPCLARDLLGVLARLAPRDELAARTLLQALMPGLKRVVREVGNDDLDAADDIVALAWERIRTYPETRTGSVAANVVLDVRKRYLKARHLDRPSSISMRREPVADANPLEDQVLATLQLEEILEAKRSGLVSPACFEAMVRTRLGGESLAELAVEAGIGIQVVCQRRWRAERRLRQLPLAG